MDKGSGVGPWTPEMDAWLARIAPFGDAGWLAKVFGRSVGTVEARCRALGIEPGGRDRAGDGKASWCGRCRRPRIRLDADGECPVCKERESANRLRRRKAVMACTLGPADILRWRSGAAALIEAADLEAARAECNALAVELATLDDYLASRDGRAARG